VSVVPAVYKYKNKNSSESEETMLRSKKSAVAGRQHGGEYTVEYNSRSHLDIIFQLRGSVWPHVIKFCLFNAMFTLFCSFVVKPRLEDKFKMTGKGHALMAIVVSFLVVTRVNLALAQYKEARANLSKMLTSTRDLVSATVSNTKYSFVYTS
jgi:predicted membrane chloride channel (bestrophin family)